jgi:hypothetical protein
VSARHHIAHRCPPAARIQVSEQTCASYDSP